MAPAAGEGVVVEPKGVVKVLLHAAKYPHAQVLGLLLGPKDGSGGPLVVVDDAVPLFHHQPMAPLLETAFLLVEEWALSTGKRLAGLYYAPVASSSSKEGEGALPGLVAGLGEKLEERYPGTVVIKVNWDGLGKDGKAASPALLEGWVLKEGRWSRHSQGVKAEAGGVEAFNRRGRVSSSSSKKGVVVTSVVDMDEHLDDCKHDFLHNPQVDQLLLLRS